MRLLLGSGGFATEDRRDFLVERMREHFGGVSTILFVPYAIQDHDRYLRRLAEARLDAGYELQGIHRAADPAQAVDRAQAIYVGGGNTFRLAKALHDHGLIEPIRRRVREGVPYMGVSAGSNVACPTIQTTNDMPIVAPPSFEALDLVPFQINPHYFSGHTFVRKEDGFQEHFGETRDDRIREYHEEEARVVVGLWEGAVLLVGDDRVRLVGGDARVFPRGAEPFDVRAGAQLDGLS